VGKEYEANHLFLTVFVTLYEGHTYFGIEVIAYTSARDSKK
jgi:hypothetical protein